MPYGLDKDSQWVYIPGGGAIPSPGLYSWENLAELSDKAAQSPNDYMEWVGFIKTAYVDGFVVNIRISHVQQDWGFVFEFLEGPTHRMNSTTDYPKGWPTCELRSWLNETYILSLPQELQSVLKEIEITSNTRQDVAGGDRDQKTNDKLWLPSITQINRTIKSVGNADNYGKLFQYYHDHGGRYYTYWKEPYDQNPGSSYIYRWWTRHLDGIYGLCCIEAQPGTSTFSTKDDEAGTYIAAPCFCITAA